MKEIEHTNKWKGIHVHGLKELIFLKCPYYQKPYIDLIQFLSRLQQHSLEMQKKKTILKFVCNYKRSLIVKVILGKNNKIRGDILPDFKLYYKTIVIKTVWHWHKNRQIHQRNNIESTEINTSIYGQPILDKRVKEYAMEKRQSVQ